MKPKPTWLTHSAVAALSFGIALIASRPDESTATATKQSPRENRTRISSSARSADPGAKVRSRQRSSHEYREAWHALAAKRLKSQDRYRLQVELLKRWAEVDLEAALTAALAEPWDDDVKWGGGIDDLLEGGFGQVFLDRSDDVWRMIREKQFGTLGSALVRDAWVAALGREQPDLILSYLTEMDGMVFRNALTTLAGKIQGREQAKRLWDKLSGRTDWPPEAVALLGSLGNQFALHLSTKDLREKLAGTSGPMAETACAALACKLCWWGNDEAVADFRAEIDQVPEHLQDRFAYEILTHTYDNKAALTTAFDFLIENEQWELLGRKEAGGQVGRLAAISDPAEMAEWAVNLPQRAETAEMFHRGVEPFIRQDRAGAWDWISQLETGIWRDRAYAEYSQQSLRRFNDPDQSRQALDQIEDPNFKQTAEKWRKDWEREKGWTGG